MSRPLHRPRWRLRAVAGATAVCGMLALAAGPAFAAGTLFVSTTGSDAHPCTLHKPCLTIGHALSIARPGTTISVAAGTYAESVTIPMRVRLLGHHSVLDATGSDNGIVISGPGARGTRIWGFTVENANAEGILAVSTSHLKIAHNELVHDDQTPGASHPVQCADQGNVPGDCGEAIHLMGVTHSTVSRNFVHDNVGGILITDETGPSHDNLIARNVALDNAEDCGITLPSHNGKATSDPNKGGVYDNTVVGNLSESNGGAGVGMFAPFPGTASYRNRIINNTLIDNGEAGIGIHAHSPGENVGGNSIIDNTVVGNGVDPDADSGHPVGIALLNADSSRSPRERIRRNRITQEFWGIFVNGSFNLTDLNTDIFGTVTSPIGHHA